jgi:ABC-type uncharacterized transport system substrate-binding protein
MDIMARILRLSLGFVLGLLIATLVTVWSLGSARAHPHVSVINAATINIEQGAIQSIAHVWTFDEFYSTAAVDGLPKNAAGGYGRAELAELAKVNIDGLKEFGYFTYVTLAGAEVKIGDPKPDSYWLEHKDGVLSLHFTVPLEKPVLVEAKGFAVTVTDPSYFIAFDLAKKDPAKLNDAAPKNCKADVGVPKPDTPEQKKLSGVFAEQLGGAALGFGETKSILVSCSS